MTIRAPGLRPASDGHARPPTDRQRFIDVGLALLYGAVFLGPTVIQLGTFVVHLPWISRSVDPGILGIQPTVAVYSRAAIGFVVVCAVALAWWRTRPERTFLVIGAVGAVQIAIGEPIRFWNIAMPIALFSAAAYGSRRFARMALLIAILGYVAASAAALDLTGRLGNLPNPIDALGTPRGATAAVLFALLVLVWAMGDQVRAARERVERDLERTEQRAREQEANVRIGTLAERQRIARELHDVVAHGLSVMIVQADGALYAEAEHPEAPREALATIASTGRESLAEMRRLLGALRDDPDAAQLTPQPGLGSLPALIERFEESGLDVRYTEEGTVEPVPAAVGLAAYRVIQESLTNVLHHAGPTGVDVRVAHQADVLEVAVTNQPGVKPLRPPRATPGLGLLGMRERVGILDGRMTAGPTTDGGFRVTVHLPLRAAPADPDRQARPDERQAASAPGPEASAGGA